MNKQDEIQLTEKQTIWGESRIFYYSKKNYSILVKICLIACSRVQPIITQRRSYLYKILQNIYNLFGIAYQNSKKLQK